MQLLSELIDKLNETLSSEYASVDRIISRIDQTPIQEVKQRLKRYLKETYIQKNRLRRIIIKLGGKPTDVKAELSLPFVSATARVGNNLPKNVNSNTDDSGLSNDRYGATGREHIFTRKEYARRRINGILVQNSYAFDT
jgi:hypothetical protein